MEFWSIITQAFSIWFPAVLIFLAYRAGKELYPTVGKRGDRFQPPKGGIHLILGLIMSYLTIGFIVFIGYAITSEAGQDGVKNWNKFAGWVVALAIPYSYSFMKEYYVDKSLTKEERYSRYYNS